MSVELADSALVLDSPVVVQVVLLVLHSRLVLLVLPEACRVLVLLDLP
jgi:uncharacterized protein (UPF0548 family)